MLSKKLSSTYLLNFLGFLAVFISMTLFVFYQVFVYPDYQRIPFRQFLQPQFLSQAFSHLFHQPAIVHPSGENNIIVLPQCADICRFQIINTTDSSLLKTIPAIVDIDAAGRLKDLKMGFFDAQAGLIGYQSITANPVFYVINFDQELLQAIQLRLNNQVDLSFVEYRPATREILFHSINHITGQEREFLYLADQPLLKVLD